MLHRKPGEYDFWVAPGSGAEEGENLHATARRGVLEECGLHVESLKIAYVEEFANPHTRSAKSGSPGSSAPAAVREHLVEAAWLSRSEFDDKTVFPPMLRNE